MAYSTSTQYKENIYSEDSKQTLDVRIDNTDIESKYIKSISQKDAIFESNNFSLGSTIKNQYVITIDNEALKNVKDYNNIVLNFNLIIDKVEESVPLGAFLMDKKEDGSNNSTKLTIVDYMKKLENVFFDFSELLPCTRYDLLKAICEYCGLELENESIVNGDVIVDVYDNTIDCKKYVSFIAERSAGYAKTNRYNKLVIRSFKDVDVVELPTGKVGDYKYNELKTITGIIYENATQKFESGNNAGEVIFLAQDSPFTCSQEEVDNIYNALNGLSFQGLEVKIWGDPAIDTGDIIVANGIRSFAQKEWNFGNGFYGSYKTSLEKVVTKSNVERISSKEKIKKILAQLDEVSLSIRQMVERIDETNSQMAEVLINLDGIEQTVTSTVEDVTELTTTVKETITSNAEKIEAIEKKVENGVETLKNSLVTIDINGINVSTNVSKISTLITNDTFAIVNDQGAYLAFFGYNEAEKRSISQMDNLTITNFLTAGAHRQEKFVDPDTGEVRTGWAYTEVDL